ncbi:MAG TPA: hypothetical protein VN950_03455 [Terriglobales bacterium]|nr:hypothetical protein [Terriglobales bacterium]
MREIGGSDLQRVEHQAGGLVVDLTSGQQAHDLGERKLDRVGVLEDRQVVGCVALAAGAVGVEFEALFALAFVVVAETVVADGGRSARRAIGHDMQTHIGQTGHNFSLAVSPWPHPR